MARKSSSPRTLGGWSDVFCFLLCMNYSFGGAAACDLYGQVLACRQTIPTPSDLQSEAINAVQISELPPNSWLSFKDTDNNQRHVRRIEVRSSKIDTIDEGFFAAVSGNNMLRKLILQGVGGKAAIDDRALRGLSNSLNQLTVIGDLYVDLEAVSKLSELTELELQRTKTSEMPDNFVHRLRKLRYLSLSNTNLTNLPWDSISKWVAGDRTRNLRVSQLALHCDCEIASLKHLPPGPVTSSLAEVECTTPAKFANVKFKSITLDELCPSTKSPDSSKPNTDGSNPSENNDKPVVPSSGGSSSGENPQEVSEGIRTEVIIAGAVVGVVLLAFIIFIIIYKVRLSQKKKTERQKRERGGSSHQSKKYCHVVETPIQAYKNDGRSSFNEKSVNVMVDVHGRPARSGQPV